MSKQLTPAAQLQRVLSWIHGVKKDEPKIYVCKNGHRSYFQNCETCKARQLAATFNPKQGGKDERSIYGFTLAA